MFLTAIKCLCINFLWVLVITVHISMNMLLFEEKWSNCVALSQRMKNYYFGTQIKAQSSQICFFTYFCTSHIIYTKLFKFKHVENLLLAVCPSWLWSQKGLFLPQRKRQTHAHLKLHWSQTVHQTFNVIFYFKFKGVVYEPRGNIMK